MSEDLKDKVRIINPTYNKIRVKRLAKGAILPKKARKSDAGFDLYSTANVTIPARSRALIPTNIAMEIPEGYCGFVCGRSGNTIKRGLVAQLGIIDSGYRNGIGIMAFNETDEPITVEAKERAAQILIIRVPNFELVEADELSDSERGLNGFGSSGQ